MSTMRILIAVLGFGGALVFGAAFAASYARPQLVERVATSVVRAEVERRVDREAAELAGGPVGSLAARVAGGKEAEVAQVRRLLADSLQARVARVTAEMRDPACACRDAAAGAVRPLDWRGAVLSQANERLTALTRAQYLDVSARLTRELRIFTAANALVLLILGLAVVIRRNARLHLLPPAAILVCAAGVVGWFYLFQQDWLHTVVFSDYVGLSYFAYLGAAFALLADVLLNRGRVTAALINAGANVVGGAASISPC